MAGASNNPASDFMQSLTKFRQVLTHIENDYVDEVNSEEFVESAIASMLEDLVPHTSYFPA